MYQISIVLFGAVTLCSLVGGYRRFGGTHHPPSSSYTITRCHNQENHSRHFHRRENVISQASETVVTKFPIRFVQAELKLTNFLGVSYSVNRARYSL
jgi:hypothetical protein